MTGSSSTGMASVMALFHAKPPASLKANSDESTVWYEPSYSLTFTSTTG